MRGEGMNRQPSHPGLSTTGTPVLETDHRPRLNHAQEPDHLSSAVNSMRRAASASRTYGR
jgi:hypothetical protein